MAYHLVIVSQLLLLCCVTASAVVAAEPVRIVVLSRYSEAVQEAAQNFEKKHGANVITAVARETDVAPEIFEQADVIVFHYLSAVVYERYAPQVKAAAARGALVLGIPGDNLERLWQIKVDAKLLKQAELYWQYGGTENLTNFLALLFRAARATKSIEITPPQPQAATGIYHPKAKQPFATLSEYLAWYRAQQFVPQDAPLAAITFYSNNHKFNDLAHIDALIARLEREGIGAIAAFGWPIKNLRAQLLENETSPVRVILALNLGFSKPDDADELARYNVPVINLMTTRESTDEWIASLKGITSDRLPTQLNSPERVGANEPVLIAGTEKIEGSTTTHTKAVPERIEMAVKRARRWLTLQTKPNADKRVAFIYYSNPPGKGYLGASYFNLLPSLLELTGRLKKEGYQVGDVPPDEKQLIEMLHRSGRNIEEWAPGELEEMSRQVGVTLLPVSKYRKWYAELPTEFRQAVERVWGPPEKSNLMTIRQRDGAKTFVLPGVQLGNVFLGPQPLRNTFDRATQVQHDLLTPPPHSYIAAYLWYRNAFKADAVVHLGRHGTLEWLPGKHVGQAGWDSSEALLADLPDPYYFIIDGGGEAIQARRRAAGVMIGHLTPMIVPGGEQPEYEPLHQLMDQYESTVETSPNLAEEYKKQALAEIQKLKIDKQLGFDVQKNKWEDVYQQTHDFLHEVESGPTPMGQATTGRLPREAVQREALSEFLRTAFQDNDLKLAAPHLQTWADALFDGKPVQAPATFNAKLKDKTNNALREGQTWLANLRRSPQMELDALVNILNGRYHASGLLGDPLRNPASLPSGRNLHDFDTALIPTKAAWELGKKMAAQTIERYKADTGKFPEKISMVLWYGETGRSHGAMESEAMYLMGVEPKWNARGVVDGLRLIPDEELGRPRVDVIFTISGIYRDGFGDKALWLDRAARLAASAKNSVLAQHDREVKEALLKQGINAEQAEKVAQARVFGAAPGMYGVGGIQEIVSQSKDEGKEKGLAEMYLHHMNHAYSEKLWGDEVGTALHQHLKGNQAVIHSRTTYVYGLLDNDDSYQFAGGLNIATKSVNDGAPPQFYINNLRARGKEKIESFRTFLVKELSTRYWNPKWIREQQNSGYAGARQFVKEMEYLYGWQATSKEHIDGQLWQKSFDVYVADKNGLAMDAFFEQANPHARQWQLARMLEVDHQGTYKFSDADRGALIERYVKSVIAHGAACSANTCGNAQLHEFIARQAPMVTGLGNAELQAFAQAMAKATRWDAEQFANAPAAFQAGLAQNLGKQTGAAREAKNIAPRAAAPATNQATAQSEQPIVTGHTMQEQVIKLTAEASRSLPVRPVVYLAMLALVLAGVWRELRRAF